MQKLNRSHQRFVFFFEVFSLVKVPPPLSFLNLCILFVITLLTQLWVVSTKHWMPVTILFLIFKKSFSSCKVYFWGRRCADRKTARIGTPLVQIRSFLPVAESFGFTQLLRQKTAGQAFPQMKFDHWEVANGNNFVISTFSCFDPTSFVQETHSNKVPKHMKPYST